MYTYSSIQKNIGKNRHTNKMTVRERQVNCILIRKECFIWRSVFLINNCPISYNYVNVHCLKDAFNVDTLQCHSQCSFYAYCYVSLCHQVRFPISKVTMNDW